MTKFNCLSARNPSAMAIAPNTEIVPKVPIWRFSVAQYHAMIRKGILDEDDPVELLEGWLVTKVPKTPPSCLSTGLAREAIASLLSQGYFVDTHEPFTTDDSEPEPDVMVVKGERRDFLQRHPHGDEVELIVEVADASLSRDRKLKRRLYARVGVPVYWIINLNKRQVEVYAEPTGAGEKADYRVRRDYQEGDEIPLLLEGRETARLSVNALLP